jgi:DNA-binding HxlR family transcriptional regulator
VTATRIYGQMCPIARALDVVGERWSLLIVRELLLGPKRFKDLLAELPAMGTNRLSDRLKSLESDGVVTRATLPPPAEAQVYALTEVGEGLREPVVALARWGAGLPLDERLDPKTARGALLALVRCATAPSDALPAAREIYDFAIADERFHIIAGDGIALPRSGPTPLTPDVTVQCDLPTLIALDAGALTPAAARRDCGAHITGSGAAVGRTFKVMRRR